MKYIAIKILSRIGPYILLNILFIAFTLFPNIPFANDNLPILREERKIRINGVQETWRLEWLSTPRPACQPENGDDNWNTCPCMGFAYGESGDLRLARIRPGRKTEYLLLNPLFSLGDDLPASNGSVLRRWDTAKGDSEINEKTLIDIVKKRPLAKIMNFKDYDHDGRATEFVLQIYSEPCGKERSVVVGISRKKNRLHVFTNTGYPKVPLVLSRWEWEKLAKARNTIRVTDWLCGDHAATEETEFELKALNGKIYGKKRTYECTGNTGSPCRGRLLRTEILRPFDQLDDATIITMKDFVR